MLSLEAEMHSRDLAMSATSTRFPKQSSQQQRWWGTVASDSMHWSMATYKLELTEKIIFLNGGKRRINDWAVVAVIRQKRKYGKKDFPGIKEHYYGFS